MTFPYELRNSTAKIIYTIWGNDRYEWLWYMVWVAYIKSLFIRYNLDEMSVWMAQDELNRELNKE